MIPISYNVRSLLGSIRSLAQHESNASDVDRDSRVGFNYIIALVNKLDHWLRDPKIDQAIVFSSTQIECDALAEELQQAGFSAVALHGAMSQGLRNRRLMALREGRVQILVATDVAARGIDVPSITHVFNYGLPMKAEDYTHRIGRTGRAGERGVRRAGEAEPARHAGPREGRVQGRPRAHQGVGQRHGGGAARRAGHRCRPAVVRAARCRGREHPRLHVRGRVARALRAGGDARGRAFAASIRDRQGACHDGCGEAPELGRRARSRCRRHLEDVHAEAVDRPEHRDAAEARFVQPRLVIAVGHALGQRSGHKGPMFRVPSRLIPQVGAQVQRRTPPTRHGHQVTRQTLCTHR